MTHGDPRKELDALTPRMARLRERLEGERPDADDLAGLRRRILERTVGAAEPAARPAGERRSPDGASRDGRHPRMIRMRTGWAVAATVCAALLGAWFLWPRADSSCRTFLCMLSELEEDELLDLATEAVDDLPAGELAGVLDLGILDESDVWGGIGGSDDFLDQVDAADLDLDYLDLSGFDDADLGSLIEADTESPSSP